jgi:hypothetical protein
MFVQVKLSGPCCYSEWVNTAVVGSVRRADSSFLEHNVMTWYSSTESCGKKIRLIKLPNVDAALRLDSTSENSLIHFPRTRQWATASPPQTPPSLPNFSKNS